MILLEKFKKIILVLISLILLYLIPSITVFAEDEGAETGAASLEKAKDLLSKMTLEEKIGQMMQPDINCLNNKENVTKYALGSLLCGGNSGPKDYKPESWADMIDSYQELALKTRLHIPILFGIDALHGNNRVYSAVIFPFNIGIGTSHDTWVAETAGRITALECAAIGAYWTFAPCVAVAKDPRWGRTYESFSEDSELTAEMGAAFLKGLQGTNISNQDSILGTSKHFLGDGGTVYGTGINSMLDEGDTRVSEDELRKVYLRPYVDAVKAGVRAIMVSYSSWNGKKMHGNKYLLTDVLKNELGFTGFLVSDWGGYKQLPGSFEEQIRDCVNAGMDMLMIPDNLSAVIETLKRLVKEGKVPESRIDDAVLRILRVKFEMDIFSHPFADRELLKQVGSAEHRELARKCVQKSVVLLKNEDNLLPLSQDLKKILVAGEKADDIGSQCGGWTLTWQGNSGNITTGTTILKAVKNAVSPSTKVVYVKTPEDIKGQDVDNADVIIAVVGEKAYSEFFGDRELPYIDFDDNKLMIRLSEFKKSIVTILISGRPLMINKILPVSRAFLAVFLPGTEGDGIADVIFGKYYPTAKLPMSWPMDKSQFPLRTGDADYNPLFLLGDGLTY